MSLYLFSCNGQKEHNTNNKTVKPKENKIKTMEKFNIDMFNKNQKNGEWSFIDENGNKVRVIKDQDDGYVKETKIKSDYFDIYKYFDINGNLINKGKEYHGGGFNKGIWIKYNNIGEIIEEFNYDKPYENYPWEKVEAYLISRKVDLKDNYTRVWREENTDGTFWMISWDAQKLSKIGTKTITNIVIDVKTEKVVKEYTTIYKDN